MTFLIGGPTPEDGLSAYQIAINNGFVGTEAQWLASLIGADGKSAYEVAVANGFSGTQSQWLASIIGPPGPQGIQGPSGIAATTYTPWNFGLGAAAGPGSMLTAAQGECCTFGRMVHLSGYIAFSADNGQFLLPAITKFGIGGTLGPHTGLGTGSPTLFFANPGSNIVSFSGTSFGSNRYVSISYLTN